MSVELSRATLEFEATIWGNCTSVMIRTLFYCFMANYSSFSDLGMVTSPTLDPETPFSNAACLHHSRNPAPPKISVPIGICSERRGHHFYL